LIVLDASALADVVVPTPLGARIGPLVEAHGADVHAPALIDAEAASAIRRIELRGDLSEDRAWDALTSVLDFPLVRYPCDALLARAWELRHNLTVYDGLYVALAEAIGAALVTTDARLALAAERHAAVEVVTWD
jgi:predicted nucleic acid-binding protein